MNIDSIERGVVIDHIEAGKGMEIVRLLKLDKLSCTVAVIRNARSNKTKSKDIIKIEDEIDVNLDVLGFINPNITVNIIVDGKISAKKRLTPPKQVVNVVQCKNPRCITSAERGLDQIFRCTEEGQHYHCVYCEQEYQPVDL